MMSHQRRTRYLLYTALIVLPFFFCNVSTLAPQSVDRRQLLASSASLWIANPTTTDAASALADELDSARQIPWRIPRKDDTSTPFASLRYGTSTLSDKSNAPTPADPPLSYPPWMEGTWRVRYKFVTASFPQGKGILSLRVPGAGLATCLTLPNVGYNPAPFEVRFNDKEDGGVCEDLAYNLPRHLEAFWPQAKVTSVRTGSLKDNKLSPPCYVTGSGCTAAENPNLHSPSARVVLEYEAPTRAGPRRIQSIDETAVAGLATMASPNCVLTCRQFVQYNVQQELQTYFKEMARYTRNDNDGSIEGLVRVAAFLPYQENISSGSDNSKYDETLALATYTYKLSMERISG